MRAMILSAGYGTRLWPLTEDRTKPAIPILGKPLVGYVAEYLAGYGFDEIVVNLHHRPAAVAKGLGGREPVRRQASLRSRRAGDSRHEWRVGQHTRILRPRYVSRRQWKDH